MDDDDERQEEENEEEEDEPAIRSYSKRRHFGKSSRDLKLFNFKAYYRPRWEILKPLKLTLQSSKGNLADSFGSSTKCKLQHKHQFQDFKSTTTFNLNLKRYLQIQSCQLNSKIKTTIRGNSFLFVNQLKDNWNATSKITHTLTLFDRLKVKYGLQFEKKSENLLGGHVNFQFVRKIASPFSFISQYNDLFTIGSNLKQKKSNKYDATYKSHLITHQNHRLYLQHKSTYDPNSKNTPFTHALTFNVQDANSIGTINTSINFEDFRIKSKEARLVIQYDKKFRFGLQKKNQAYQFMIERYKMKQKLLKSLKLYAGNKGVLGVFDGRINFSKINLDYLLSLKLKLGGRNFYDDFSMGLNLKWNI